MDLRKIKKLIELAEEAGISELEVKSGDEAVRIVRHGASPPITLATPALAQSAAKTKTKIRAPMAGTFYTSPEPGAEPFVREGQPVQVGDVVCIIESMKMMNEIRAEAAGIISAALAINGQAINAGEPLFQLD